MYPWYDSWWLDAYATAKGVLAESSPAIRDRFVRDMAVFRTRPDFTVQTVDGLLEFEPEQAAIFSGSSQWHYRNRMPPGPGRQFCELLFFHYVPAGTRDLVCPDKWAELFGAPELAGIVEVRHGDFI